MQTLRLKLAIAALFLMLSLCSGSFSQPIHAASTDAIKVLFNDKPLQFTVPPEQVSGRVLVPMRGVFEALDATITYDAATKKIVAVRGDTNVKLQTGSTAAEINGKAVALDVPAQTRSGHTFVPLRFVSEAMGVKVSWNGTDRIVEIRNRLVNKTDGAEMVLVPAGEFSMGNGNGAYHLLHKVTLDEYWIYKNPVTVAQYKSFCTATGRNIPSAPEWGWKDDHPMVKVGWNDAVAYCEWAGTRLPTEAEWEKAARGTDGRLYPWGNEWSKDKLHCSDIAQADAKGTAPVGSFPAGVSPYGCLDMVGPIVQWCSDWYGEKYYSESPAQNPQGPPSGTEHVVRGGGWPFNEPWIFTTWQRWMYHPDYSQSFVGFRCVQDG